MIGNPVLTKVRCSAYCGYSAHKSAKSDYQSKNTIDTLVVFSSGIQFSPLGLATYSMANNASNRLDQAANTATIASVLFIGFYAVNLLDVFLFGGNDATAQNSLEEYFLSKKNGFKFNASASAVNGNLNKKCFSSMIFISEIQQNASSLSRLPNLVGNGERWQRRIEG